MKISNFLKGLLLNISLSSLLLTMFYGNLFPVLNKVYFSNDGDGLVMYANMLYHENFSKGYMRCNSMNYPYGEHAFFTNNQPFISNSIKFLATHGIDLKGETVGIVNGLMIISILFAALLLFLILWEFGVGWWLAALAGIGIAFLSPQLDRFGGHFSLSYVCSIPWFIYIVIRFFKKPGWGLSILISITAFIAALTHFYLYAFLGIIALFFYGAFLLNGKRIGSNKYIWIAHFVVQFVLPFLILQGFYFADSVTDRPEHPWGFLVYRAYPQSIFLPISKPYGTFLRSIIPCSYIEWEGYAFVGLAASVFTFILLYNLLRNLIKKEVRKNLAVTSDFYLNVLFWASIVSLLYSFGIPYILGLQWLVDYTGPLQQMRGIARFSWIFYFVINITLFYWLWKYHIEKGKTLYSKVLIVLSLTVLYYDGYTWARGRGKALENYLPEMQDNKNVVTGNQWINRIRIADYQALLPIPYFHVGSENIWIEKGCNILRKSLITGSQTGLPSMAVMMSRTSIGQTCNLLSLMLEPSWNGLKDLKFPSEKPILLLAARCNEISADEKKLIDLSRRIDSTDGFDMYSLPVTAFRDIYLSGSKEATNMLNSGKLNKFGNKYLSDSIDRVLWINYDSLENKEIYAGRGGFSGIAKEYNKIVDNELPHADTSLTYSGSFWVGLFRRDLTPRTNIIITETDTTGKEISYESTQVFRKLVQIDGDWGLVEWSFKLHNPKNKIQVFLRNAALHRDPLVVDELLIRPSSTDVIINDGIGLRRNNRLFRPLN